LLQFRTELLEFVPDAVCEFHRVGPRLLAHHQRHGRRAVEERRGARLRDGVGHVGHVVDTHQGAGRVGDQEVFDVGDGLELALGFDADLAHPRLERAGGHVEVLVADRSGNVAHGELEAAQSSGIELDVDLSLAASDQVDRAHAAHALHALFDDLVGDVRQFPG
jgi:hypothetical protein